MTSPFWDDVRMLFEAALEEQPAGLTSWLTERTTIAEVRHQEVMLILYFSAAAVAWQMKEWQRAPLLLWIFLATAVLAAAAGILRGHLLFCERADPSHLPEVIRQEGWITMRLDLSIAGLALAGALYVSARHPLAAALTMALGIGFGLAALTIEPATTRAAFGKPGE